MLDVEVDVPVVVLSSNRAFLPFDDVHIYLSSITPKPKLEQEKALFLRAWARDRGLQGGPVSVAEGERFLRDIGLLSSSSSNNGDNNSSSIDGAKAAAKAQDDDSVQITLRMSREQLERLTEVAKRQGIPRASYIKRSVFIQLEVDEQGK